MKQTNFSKACAIGLYDYEKYDHKKFIKECKKYKNLIPIAGLNPKKSSKKISKEDIPPSTLKLIEEAEKNIKN